MQINMFLKSVSFKSVVLSSVLGALLSTASALAATLPHTEFNGVWQVQGKTMALLTADGKQPPLLPAAKAAYEQRRQSFRRGDRQFDQTLQCQPPGVPRLGFDAMPFEIMVQARQVLLMHQWNRLVRFIDIDKAHTEPLGPTFLGQSVGRWEGDTLVVDTNGFNDSTLLDAEGMPHSDQMQVVERYTVNRNGQQLQALITITDPQTFAAPWTTKVNYRRLKGTRIAEDVCVERLNLDQYK